MNRFLGKTGIFFLHIFGFLPFWFMYLMADITYTINYHIIGYRKHTVLKNLRNSFPEKTEKEIRQISKAFYHHFFDLIFETIKGFQASKETINKRVHYRNPEVLDELYKRGKNVTLISGHYGNWEWISTLPLVIKHQVNVIYRSIENRVFDDYMKKIRSRFGMFLIPANNSLRTMLESEKKGQLSATYYLADQTASYDTKYWIMFLNQETLFFPGSEKVATRFSQAVVFMDIQKVRRGYYEVEFTKLFDDASQTKEFEVTKTHVKFLENIISTRPEFWLWSHKRWKHKRPEHTTLK